MNKLDLVFEKQPPEVKRKLMNLLLQYNASLQYNKDEDKFEVDLLLPFKDQKQKQDFVKNFQSRQSRRSEYNTLRTDEDVDLEANVRKEINVRKGSQIDKLQFTQSQDEMSITDKSSEIAQENLHQIRQDDPQISLNFTNEYSLSHRRNTFNLKDISSIIQNKLKIAVEQIKQNNSNKKSFNYGDGSNSSHISQTSFELKKVQMDSNDDMILHNLDEKNHEYQSTDHGKQYQSERKPYDQNENNRSKGYENENSHNSAKNKSEKKSNSQIEMNNQILIEDDLQQKMGASQYNSLKLPSNEIGLFSDEEYPYMTEKIEERQEESEFILRKVDIKNEGKSGNSIIGKVQRESPEKVKILKQRLTSKYATNKSANGSNTRQRYTEFFKKNHRDFSKIYDTIKKDIKRNRTDLQKSSKDSPILILQQSLSTPQNEEDKIFKQEVIKQYQKNIVVHYSAMSSEDMVRYLRYLMQLAKNMYIKQLRQGK